MVKHELLDVLSLSSKGLTIRQVLPQSGSSYVALFLLFKRLVEQGLVQVVLKNGKTKTYQITDRGQHRLEYFEETGCSNKNCLICNRQ
jgi:predicted transcriptional regulator